MTQEDRFRWDDKYSKKEISETLNPDQWLVEMTADLQPGRAWEPACGMGHNAVWLAGQGWSVDAIDISPVALKHAKQLAENHSQSVNWIAADLDDFIPNESQYDLVIVFRFLDRLHLPGIIQSALKPGGILLYETFSAAQFDRPDNHLRQRSFALETDELPRLFSELKEYHYSERELPDRTVARFAGQVKK
jgi:tellurite methyltransferase